MVIAFQDKHKKSSGANRPMICVHTQQTDQCNERILFEIPLSFSFEGFPPQQCVRTNDRQLIIPSLMRKIDRENKFKSHLFGANFWL